MPPASVPNYGGNDIVASKSISDYYGIPVGMNFQNHSVNVLPFRGYVKIWNDWFRNQNVQAPIPNFTDDTSATGINFVSAGQLLKVNKPFDYFTSALPAPQKGLSQLIPIELNQLIPVITSTSSAMSGAQEGLIYKRASTGAAPTNAKSLGIYNAFGTGYATEYDDNLTGAALHELYPANLFADATGMQINGTTISDLRTAFQIQRLYERDARGGTRYIEMLKAHFGVDAGDYRLQRPEYLGHCSTLMNINQVDQTSATESGVQATPLGTTGGGR